VYELIIYPRNTVIIKTTSEENTAIDKVSIVNLIGCAFGYAKSRINIEHPERNATINPIKNRVPVVIKDTTSTPNNEYESLFALDTL
jgi:hypothetical protein